MSVELFSITCTTCKARLKVRNEQAVGLILACPKCGSMVQVVPPQGWQSGPAEVSAAPVAAPRTGPPPIPTRPATAPALELNAEPPPNQNAATAATSESTSGELAGATRASRWPALLLAMRSSNAGLLAGGCAAGVGVGLGMWGLIVWLAGSEPKASASAAPPSAATRSAVPGRSAPPPVAAAPSAPGTKLPAPQPAVPVAQEPAGAAPPREAAAPAPDAPAQPAPMPQPAPVADPMPEPAPPPSADPPAAPQPVKSSSRDAIERRLGEPVAAIEFAGQSLSEVALLVGQLTSVSVTCDEPALSKAGKSSRLTVSLKLRDTTAAEILRQAVSAHGLVYEIRDARIVITAAQRGAP